VVVGPNGHGKTSLIEAAVYAQVFRSFRGAADRELTRFGSDGFWIETRALPHGGRAAPEVGAAPTNGTRTVSIGYDVRTRAKRVTVDGVEPAAMGGAIGLVRAVVLSPADVALVAGGPKTRRRYLDVLLALTVVGYVGALARYRRALAQRARARAPEAGAFENVLAESGALIVAARRAWADRWSAGYGEQAVAMGERGESRLAYVPRTEGGADALRRALEHSRSRDRELGQTTVGPHRDELRLTLDGRALRTYGSAGQQRTAALALRLLEAATLREAGAGGGVGGVGGAEPLMCLDDAFAELDTERCARLGALIERWSGQGAQILAAVPRAADVPDAVASLPRWRVCDGRIEGA